MTKKILSGMPANYEVCFRNECPLKETCLRHHASQEHRKNMRFIPIVNPYLVEDVTESCPFYRSDEPVSVAYGISHIFDYVPSIKHDLLYHSVKDYFGKYTYYRIYHKVRPIMPEEQEVIQRIFKNNGINEPVKYDEYTEIINW